MTTIALPSLTTNQTSMEDYIARRVSYWTGKLTKQLRLSKQDAEDFQQDMHVEVCDAMQRFDSDRSCQRTYISHVLNRYAKKLIRRTLRQRRNPTHSTTPLSHAHELVVNDASEGLAEVQLVDLRLDLETFLNTLSPRLKQVASLLAEHSPAQVAKELGWHRSSVHRAMDELRDKLKEAGFEQSDLLPR